MATKTVLVDDLDGGTADATVTFALDGRSYSLDLSSKNAAKLREALQPYVIAATSISEEKVALVIENRSSIEQRTAIRKWARKKGYEIAERGRIPQEVQEAFDEAHKQ